MRYKCDLCEYAAYRRKGVEIHQKCYHEDMKCKIISIGCRLCDNGDQIHTKCRFGLYNAEVGECQQGVVFLSSKGA